eukprot:TRINITY_DN15065_c0_g1_i1.p1 TRINITY_DN15065_c0_g1~~TRINITY_DN15065_c0_g1_i1.p1  ORF type:complete len:103 (-),score=22.90 TRINITY_DN15065_c0_g1_i1:127-435(-)
MVLNLREFSDVAVNSVGWVLIGGIAVSLCYLWFTTVPKVFKELYNTIAKALKKKPKPKGKLDKKASGNKSKSVRKKEIVKRAKEEQAKSGMNPKLKLPSQLM